MDDGFNIIPPATDSAIYTKQLDDLITYLEIIAGGIIEITWLAKVFLIIYIIFGAWRVVRK